jgi:hypothetical protein
MTWDYAAENARLNAENERWQEALRAERLQREPSTCNGDRHGIGTAVERSRS